MTDGESFSESGPDTRDSASTDANEVGRFPEPVEHGVGVSFQYPNRALYDDLHDLWEDRVERLDEVPSEGIVVGDYDPPFDMEGDCELRLRSSPWKAGCEHDGEWRAWRDFTLVLRERTADGLRTPPVSLCLVVEPQVNGLVYENGNPLPIPHGEGAGVRVQTTYPDGPEEVMERALTALAAALPTNEVTLERDAVTAGSEHLWKLEAHIRFDRARMEDVVQTLGRSRDLITWGGDAALNARQQRQREGWVEASVESNRWDKLGFMDVPYTESMKVYQTSDADERDASDPLAHPKLEAAYAGGGEEHPSLSAWNAVLDRLQRKVAQHALWADLSPRNLVADSHYLGPSAPMYRFDASATAGRRDDLRAMYDDLHMPILAEATKDATDAPHDLLDVVLRKNGATYDTLVQETGLSRSTVRYHIKRFADQGFVARVGNPTVVVFEAEYVRTVAEEVMDQLHAGETTGDQRTALAERAQERCTNREGEANVTDTDGSNADDTADTKRSQPEWRDFGDTSLTPDELAAKLSANEFGGEDVRVRLGALDEWTETSPE